MTWGRHAARRRAKVVVDQRVTMQDNKDNAVETPFEDLSEEVHDLALSIVDTLIGSARYNDLCRKAWAALYPDSTVIHDEDLMLAEHHLTFSTMLSMRILGEAINSLYFLGDTRNKQPHERAFHG